MKRLLCLLLAALTVLGLGACGEKSGAPTEIMATAASPWIFLFWPVFNSKTALTMVMAITKGISFVSPRTPETAMAPKATWDSPSPIKEKRFKTKVTPSSEAHRAMSTPTASAYRTKG